MIGAKSQKRDADRGNYPEALQVRGLVTSVVLSLES